MLKSVQPAPPNGDQLRDLYLRLQGHSIPSLVRVLYGRVDDRGLALKLAPLCFSRTPATEEELRAAIRDVLGALTYLHRLGYAHNDIRWSNIMWDAIGRVWVLIDLEEATLFGSPLARPLRLHAPETEGGGPVSAASDYYLVGTLIRHCYGPLQLQLSPAAWEFAEQLTRDEPARRCTEPLSHAWLAPVASKDE